MLFNKYKVLCFLDIILNNLRSHILPLSALPFSVVVTTTKDESGILPPLGAGKQNRRYDTCPHWGEVDQQVEKGAY